MIAKKFNHSERIKAILFDSGRVLNRPASGHWFIPPNFFNYVDKKKFLSIPIKQRKTAFLNSSEYIIHQKLIKSEEEEYIQFVQFYKIFADFLPELNLEDTSIQAVAKDLVFNREKYTFFEDALYLVPKLSEKYKLAVVSDAWPSLENVFVKANMRNYFSSFIISSKKGVTKPNKLMYQSALDELNISPEQAIFIDDNIRNCIGASQLGIQSLVLNRNWKLFTLNKLLQRNYHFIRNLYDIEKILV
ncbi:HAD family phosphatase [Sporolactobacillus shoreae]|uniref:HAD family phosphatase n=1 Tax=Sporolactobacillus shoreae TaxID=1465501 RepID=A0A4Z0GJ51_9BACL|nr:HAD-IA family hydrolase [Sporolactobacillus shoreae]TGA96302.1 HAD family phosphatase [Sporolactobacillus shoreae]